MSCEDVPRDIITAISALLPSYGKFLCEEALTPPCDYNGISVPTHELILARKFIQRHVPDSGFISSLTMAKSKLDRMVFTDICRIYTIALTIPVTSVSSERSFSTMKIIKTRLRSVKADDRLSTLAVIHVEQKVATALDIDRLINEFARKTNRRNELLLHNRET